MLPWHLATERQFSDKQDKMSRKDNKIILKQGFVNIFVDYPNIGVRNIQLRLE